MSERERTQTEPLDAFSSIWGRPHDPENSTEFKMFRAGWVEAVDVERERTLKAIGSLLCDIDKLTIGHEPYELTDREIQAFNIGCDRGYRGALYALKARVR